MGKLLVFGFLVNLMLVTYPDEIFFFASSINITLNLESRLRRKLHNEEEAKLNREIRSVAPTSSNDIISTRATYGGPNNR